jgi:hypothetical protein
MAKSTKDDRTKATRGEVKTRRAPERRRTGKQAVETPVAVASELAGSERTEAADLNPEEVRRRAYELYVGRGCAGGYDVDDWLEAERQLRNRNRPH